MATSSFFNGEFSAPDKDTVDELIDELNEKIDDLGADAASLAAAVTSAQSSAATATTKAAEAASSAAGVAAAQAASEAARDAASSSATNAGVSATTAAAAATNAATSATTSAASATAAAASATALALVVNQHTVTQQAFTSNGVLTAFTLASAPGSENNTQVFVNGVYQEKGSYTVVGTTLTFSEAPPAGTVEVMANGVLPVGSTTSDQVTFTPAGTGAVARNVQAKLRDVVSVEDFGAAGNGVADDRAEIVQAIASMGSDGGVLELGPKTYYCASKLSLAVPANLRGKGPAHHAFYASGTDYGTVLLVQGQAGDDLVTVGGGSGGGRGHTRIEDMSIASDGAAAISSILRLAGTLHPMLKNVSIFGTDDTDGVGLLLDRDADGSLTLYGDFIHINTANVDTGLKIVNDQNANTFTGGSIQGRVRSFLIEGPITPPVAVTFNGTAFEGTYSTAMEHEYIAPGEHIYGVGRNSAGCYAVKIGKITAGEAITFNGCYWEIGGCPLTYNDGVHGVLNLYPVVEVGTGVTNTLFQNNRFTMYVLDRGTRTRIDGISAHPPYWTQQPPVSVRRSNAGTAITGFSYTAVPFASMLHEDELTFYYDATARTVEILKPGFFDIDAQVEVDGSTIAAASEWGHIRIVTTNQTFQGPNVGLRAAASNQGFSAQASTYLSKGDTVKVEAFVGEDCALIADMKYNRLSIRQR
jgi:hypothetical protein